MCAIKHCSHSYHSSLYYLFLSGGSCHFLPLIFHTYCHPIIFNRVWLNSYVQGVKWIINLLIYHVVLIDISSVCKFPVFENVLHKLSFFIWNMLMDCFSFVCVTMLISKEFLTCCPKYSRLASRQYHYYQVRTNYPYGLGNRSSMGTKPKNEKFNVLRREEDVNKSPRWIKNIIRHRALYKYKH